MRERIRIRRNQSEEAIGGGLGELPEAEKENWRTTLKAGGFEPEEIEAILRENRSENGGDVDPARKLEGLLVRANKIREKNGLKPFTPGDFLSPEQFRQVGKLTEHLLRPKDREE